MRILLATLAIFAATSALSACHTVEGAGQDIQRGGDAISDASRDVRN